MENLIDQLLDEPHYHENVKEMLKEYLQQNPSIKKEWEERFLPGKPRLDPRIINTPRELLEQLKGIETLVPEAMDVPLFVYNRDGELASICKVDILSDRVDLNLFDEAPIVYYDLDKKFN
jgi:hypothetical protein